jgi:hypothetical protein
VPQEEKSIPEVVQELKELTITYAKQETIDPLKHAGRYVGYGLLGSLLLGLGLVMVGLGGLRFLQTETGSTLTGNWSWVPYGITAVVLAGLAALAIKQIAKDGKEAQL